MKIQLNYERPTSAPADMLVVVLDKEKSLSDLSGSPLAEIVDRVRKDFDDKKLRKEFVAPLDKGTAAASQLAVFTTEHSKAHNVWESFKISVAKAMRIARDQSLDQIAVVLNTEDAVAFVGKAVEAAILGSYTFDKYKKEKSEFVKKARLSIVALKSHDRENRARIDYYTLVSDAVNDARTLVNEPGSVVVPETLAEFARKTGRSSDLDVKIWDERKLAKDGYTGLIQVGKGSQYPPRMIRLSYEARRAKHHLAIVGKGITFDTGGISLKPADRMHEMKGDMAGAAAVLCAMKVIGKLRPDISVTGIVTTAENFPDARAQRPGDIFYARNGKSIMVDNTDAEGRLVLTDGLNLAGEEKATHILDIATLTGAVVRALGPSIAGIMGTSPPLIHAVQRSGQNHGEEYWELPLPEEYKEMLKTPYADLNNVGGPVAGALTAGLFLREFVPEGIPWAHLDIAGPFIRDKEWKYYEAGGTGFGVKTFVDLARHFTEYIG